MGAYHCRHLFDAIEKNDSSKVKKILKSKKARFEQTFNSDGQTPLQFAAKNGHVDITDLLLKNGFGANVPDGRCWFPIHYACAGGHMSVLKSLTSEELGIQKANVNNHCVVNTCKCAKQTALHVACENGYHNCVVILLTLGANLSIKDKDNNTPYDIAVNNNRDDIVNFMKPFLTVQNIQ